MKGHNFGGICRKCGETHIHPKGHSGKLHSKETKEKISLHTKESWTQEKRDERSEQSKKRYAETNGAYFGRTDFSGENNPAWGIRWHHTKDSKNKISKGTKKAWKDMPISKKRTRSKRISNANKGVEKTSDAKCKFREAAIKRIERQRCNGKPLMPAIGKEETEILDSIEEIIGEKIIRQKKAYGYFIDGYITNLDPSCAIEIDEPHHYNIDGTLNNNDCERQQYLEFKLGCKFIRIKTK